MSIPNTLTIYMNTLIPGFQKLKYRPSMTVPDAKNAKNENIYFDPLVKLTNRAIQSVPPLNPGENKEKQVASQFFNRGMFETMVNRSLSSVFSGQLLDKEGDTLNTKLKKAVENNNINQNISLTLETLFRPDSVITIGGKPYTIYSYRWDNGDWKVDTKLYSLNNNVVNASPYGRKGQIIIQNFMSPRAPNDYSKAQAEAQAEMKLLDKEVLEGDGFNKKGYVNQEFIEENRKGDTTKIKDNVSLGIPIGEKNQDAKPIQDAKPNGKDVKDVKDVKIKEEKNTNIENGPLSQDDEINKCLQEYEECILNATNEQKPNTPIKQNKQEPTTPNKPTHIENEFITPTNTPRKNSHVIDVIESKEDEDEFFVNFKNPPGESFKDSQKEKEKYMEKKSKTWIEKYMKNNNYTIKDNEGKGDCFFAVIRDAFSSIGKTKYSVEYLRELVAEAVTPENFDSYKERYTMFENLLNQQKEDLENYKNRLNEINGKLSKDEKIKELNTEIASIKSEIFGTKIDLVPYKFMENINTIEDFKEIVKTCKFWADSWAISTMERVLKIKIIILTNPDLRPPPTSNSQNIVHCGEMDPILQEECEFEPEYYIITDYTGNHYKLIGYKGTEIFTFPEIPYGLKELATRTCMARNSGLYSLIPEFQKFRDEELGFQGKRRYGLRGIKGGGDTEDNIPIANSLKPSSTVTGEVVSPTMVVEGTIFRTPEKESTSVRKEPTVSVVKTSAPEKRPVQKHINSLFFSDSKLGYFIVIDLELYPGTSIPLSERPSLACKIQKEKIKESIAELRGTDYRRSPQNELSTYNPTNNGKNASKSVVKSPASKSIIKYTNKNRNRNRNRNIKTKKQKAGFKKRTRKDNKKHKKNKNQKTRKQKRIKTKTCRKR